MAVAGPSPSDEQNAEMTTQNGIITGSVIGGMFLLMGAVLLYVCCVRCKHKRTSVAQKPEMAVVEPSHHGANSRPPMHTTEEELDGSIVTGLNVDVPLPLERRTSGYNNRDEADLQPLSHKMPTDTLEAAMEAHSIDERRLKIEDVIGRGTMSLVYNGRLYDKYPKDVTTKYQMVRIKTVHGPGCTPAVLKQFVERGMMMRRFKHVNILRFVGLVIDNDQPFILSPYTPLGDLCSYLFRPNQHFTVRMLIHMGLQVAEGLRYLAEQCFVHQDIASRNCVVDNDGHIQVGDYALSHDMFPEDYTIVEQLSEDPLPIGWMAVETLTMLTYSLETDVWSFGVLLWELMMRGHPPYANMDPATIIAFVRTGQRLERPAVAPSSLYTLMQDCWKEDPLSRPTMNTVCDRLGFILHGHKRPRKSDYKRVIDDSLLPT